MSFDAKWLALRAPADARARSVVLARRAADVARARAGSEMVRIVDLGAGTGATVDALAPLVGARQHFTLVDADGTLLAEAQRRLAGSHEACTIETRVADLAREAPFESSRPPHLITASALFDLASAAFVDRLCDALAAARVPLLAVLSFDGRLALEPPHPDDARLIALFEAHQRGEKSFGPALGPDGWRALAEALRERGALVATRRADWRLEAGEDGPLIEAKLDGWAAAARELAEHEAERIAAWRTARRRVARVHVGHRDLLALWPRRRRGA